MPVIGDLLVGIVATTTHCRRKRSATTTILFLLLWRTWHIPIAAKHTTIADFRFQNRLTIFACVKNHAGIDRHSFLFLKTAGRASDGRQLLQVSHA